MTRSPLRILLVELGVPGVFLPGIKMLYYVEGRALENSNVESACVTLHNCSWLQANETFNSETVAAMQQIRTGSE